MDTWKSDAVPACQRGPETLLGLCAPFLINAFIFIGCMAEVWKRETNGANKQAHCILNICNLLARIGLISSKHATASQNWTTTGKILPSFRCFYFYCNVFFFNCDFQVTHFCTCHSQVFYYNDVIMSAMASQITSLTIVYSTVYSGADQRKHQSSASLAFVRGIYRWPVNSPHKGPVTRKMFLFDDIIMCGMCYWDLFR